MTTGPQYVRETGEKNIKLNNDIINKCPESPKTGQTYQSSFVSFHTFAGRSLEKKFLFDMHTII